MKKSVFLSLAALLLSIASYAQQPVKAEAGVNEIPSAEQIAQRRADRLKQQLLLGQDQYKKVYKLCLEQAEQDVARMKQQQAEREKMAAAMKGILNDAQYERFEQMQASQHGRRHPQGAMHRNAPQSRCDKTAQCHGKPCCDKAGKGTPRGVEKSDGDSVKAGGAKRVMQKGERVRMIGDPRRNQNAYNYIEGAAEN